MIALASVLSIIRFFLEKVVAEVAASLEDGENDEDWEDGDLDNYLLDEEDEL